jgi:hypothetical protein
MYIIIQGIRYRAYRYSSVVISQLQNSRHLYIRKLLVFMNGHFKIIMKYFWMYCKPKRIQKLEVAQIRYFTDNYLASPD